MFLKTSEKAAALQPLWMNCPST